jgi:hypothetical protein
MKTRLSTCVCYTVLLTLITVVNAGAEIVVANGSVPADLAYLDSPKIAVLSNLSADINLAARNALSTCGSDSWLTFQMSV